MENTTIPAETIVVGVDGSEGGTRALRWALEQAVIEHRSLTLVHSSCTSYNGWISQEGIDLRVTTDVLRTAGRAVLDRAQTLAADLAPGVATRTVLEVIDARILLAGLSHEAALIVVGSRGRGPVASALLGSVAEDTMRNAACPVVVLRPGDDGSVGQGCLVGVDGTENSRAAVEFAFLQASERSWDLTVMHCFWDVLWTSRPGEVAPGEPGHDDQWLLVSEATSGMREKFPDVVVRTVLVRGDADDCLSEASSTMDMVVVGAHAKRSWLSYFGGETDRRALEHASGAVAVVPARGTRAGPAAG